MEARLLTDYLFLQGCGHLGKLIEAHPWHKTPLGPLETWPQSLRTAINIILNSHHPKFVTWGPEMTFIYNDAYIEVLGRAKHPWALGQPFEQVWTEIWDTCKPLADKVLLKGESTFIDCLQLFMNRGDFTEETYYSFSYNPVQDESGRIGGIFCPSAPITDKILSERRFKILGNLSAKAFNEKTVDNACDVLKDIFDHDHADIPFCLFYLLNAENNLELKHAANLEVGIAQISPSLIEIENADNTIWPASKVITSLNSEMVDIAACNDFPLGFNKYKLTQAVVLPLITSNQSGALGLLICGVNPCRQLDADYRLFFHLLSSHAATIINNAKSFADQKKRAEELAEIDRAKTQFFNNISHEFRTPLTLMLAPLQDLIQTSKNAKNKNLLDLVYRNSRRLLKLVNSLLDFSRIEAGRMQAKFQAADLTQVTISIASSFESAIKNSKLNYILNIEKFDHQINIDVDMWEKIISNLLSNAIKFTQAGSITLSLHKHEKTIYLIVQDSGIGISENDLSRIFERFYQVNIVNKRSHEGSGIGLSLTQELVKLLNGTIAAESTPGVGTKFTVKIPYLPLTQAKLDPLEIKSQVSDYFAEEAYHWHDSGENSGLTVLAQASSSYHILLVDDNNDMRDYIKSILQTHWQVECAVDGEHALVLAKKNPPDLILSDIMMPKLDGFGLVKKLQSSPALAMIPIILISARANEGEKIEGLKLGASDYLVKPFSVQELIARISNHIELYSLRKRISSQKEEIYSVFLQAPVGICILEGPQHVVTLVNNAALKIALVSRSSLMNLPLAVGLPYAAQQNIVKILDEVHKSAKPYVAHGFKILLDESGAKSRAVYVDFIFQPIVNQHGQVERILAVGTDVSDREVARQDVEAVDRRLKIALGVAQVGIWEWDIVKDVTTCDATTARLYGLPETQSLFPGQTLIDAIYVADRDRTMSRWYDAVKYCDEVITEYRTLWPDNTIHWVRSYAKVARDENNEAIKLIGAALEITALKQAEKSSETSLNLAIAARDEFISIASHELKTPITSLKLQCEMIKRKFRLAQDGKVSAEQITQALDMSSKQIDRLTLLIDDLLDITKIQSGNLALNLENTVLVTLIKQAIGYFGSELKNKKMKVLLDVPVTIVGKWDAARIEQVIINLLSNALKYAPGKPLHIRAHEENHWVSIEVQDFGQGIPADKFDYVFERFGRVSSAINVNGLGLGLFVCKTIIERHHGVIYVDSKLGEGATFVIKIPVDSEAVVAL